MATKHSDILDKARKAGLARPDAGMSVPDGYFEDFALRMADMLPERPEIEQAAPRLSEAQRKSFWSRVRPYVYMAAMFAGIWCMLQIFASLTGATRLEPMADNPVLAKALANDDFVMDYFMDDINSWDLVDEMMEDGTIGSDTEIHGLFADDNVPADDQISEADYILPQ